MYESVSQLGLTFGSTATGSNGGASGGGGDDSYSQLGIKKPGQPNWDTPDSKK